MMAEKPKRQRVDWDAIEPHYRAGIRALKDIGREFEVSDAAIIKHARGHGWARNLTAKIQAAADAKVSAALVSAEVSDAKAQTEAGRIEVESEIQARIRIAHRSDITRMRVLVIRLLAECEAESADPSLFADLGEMMRKPDEKGVDKLNEVYMKTISLPQRIKGVKELADALKVLIGLEREAYGIRPVEDPVAKTVVFDLSTIPAAERQAAYLKLVSGT